MEEKKSYRIITKPELIEFPTEPSELPMKSNVEEIIKISGRRCLDERLKRQYDDEETLDISCEIE